MKKLRIAMVPLAALVLASCSTFRAASSWQAKGEALPRGLTLELGPDAGGASAFRIRGDELEGGILEGVARPSGELWILEVRELYWFGNWAEGWTEATFAAEGELTLRPDGPSWAIEAAAPPKIENVVSASIRLYGDYFYGDKALGLIAHRWDRIQAADELLKEKFPDAWYDYSQPRRVINLWSLLFTRRVANFQAGVRGFLFPELYGYPKESPPAKDGARARAESINWDTEYTKERFPENLRAIRDSGTMLRDFEEGAGLWRLDFCWDALWSSRIPAAVFVKKQ